MKHFLNKNILIFAPHVDDELFGCGGFILRFNAEKQAGVKCTVVYSALGDIYFTHLDDVVSEKSRMQEIKSASRELMFEFNILEIGKTAYDLTTKASKPDIIRSVDKIIEQTKPGIIFIPAPSYHQDHQWTFDVALSALRPTKIDNTPDMILLYESAFCCPPWDGNFIPNFYVDISNYLNEKIRIYQKCYVTQASKPGFLDGLKKRSIIRGYDGKFEFAEAFQIIYARG